MSRRPAAPAAFALAVALYLGAAGVALGWGSGWRALGDPGSMAMFGAPFAVVGYVVTLRRPGHRIGWGFAVAGLCTGVQAFTSAYADAALRPGGVQLPLADYAGNLTQWIFAPAIVFGYVLPFLWMPNGEVLSRRWQWVARVAVGSTLLTVVANALDSDPLNNYPHVANPLGVHLVVLPWLNGVGLLGYVGAVFAAIGSVFLRYRRSRGIERLQMRWFMVGVAGTGVAFAAQLTFLALTGDVGPGVLLLCVLPVCAGVAILRYRLFDIDRFISRTVTYAAMTGLVVAPYVGLCVAASRLASGSAVAVAALTLVTLAALRPAHRRVQGVVDRRWNRERYDAARVADAFAQRLRDEVDADRVRLDLLQVASSAVEPASISLWVAG